MRTKYVINENFDRDFSIDTLVVSRTEYVMTFLTKSVNYRAYDVVIVNIEQFDDEIYWYVDSTLQRYDQKNK